MTDFWLSWLLLCSLFMFSVTLALMSPFPSGWPFLHGTLYRPDKYMVHPNEYVFCLINQRHLCDRQHYKKQKKQRVCMIQVMVFTLSSIRKPPSQASNARPIRKSQVAEEFNSPGSPWINPLNQSFDYFFHASWMLRWEKETIQFLWGTKDWKICMVGWFTMLFFLGFAGWWRKEGRTSTCER